MDLLEAIKARHSVRSYDNKPLPDGIINDLKVFIDEVNLESSLHIQLVVNEPKAFDSFMAHYGKFSGVKNYIALVGRNSPKLEEMCGYFGEKIVLRAQQMGLNTCWVAGTYKKIPDTYIVLQGEKIKAVIAIGYGKTQGVPHKSKNFSKVSKVDGEIPKWFCNGIETALLAPTALNQQKFLFILKKDIVEARALFGPFSNMDLGIVKYHFDIGSERKIGV